MSRSNNVELINPANKFFEWNGENGGFKYYNKEKKETIAVPLPFTFIVLDCLATIKGFDDDAKSGFWSNEVRDVSKELLTVRNKQGICSTGIYKDIIETKVLKGAKFCQSVYIAYYEGRDLQIGNIQMVGACLGAWFEFKKAHKIYDIAVSVASFTDEVKGKTEYKAPVFSAKAVTAETNEQAIELDKELQDYLGKYFARRSAPVEVEPEKEAPAQQSQQSRSFEDEKVTHIPSTAPAEEIDDLPF